MERETKIVRGQLLKQEDHSLISDAIIEIVISGDVQTEVEVFLTVIGLRPDLDNQTCLLKLSEVVIGDVFIHIPKGSIHSIEETRFKVVLGGNIWHEIDWPKLI